MAVCNESYQAVVDDNQKLQERIATQEATIKALRDDALEKAGFIVSQNNEIAELREQLTTLQSDADTEAASVASMREQLARMPVCVGYLMPRTANKLLERVTMQDVVIPTKATDHCTVPIYIDPAPQEKQG